MIKTKSKLKKYLHNRKLVVISSLLLGITMLTLFLVNAYYYQILPPILTPISINKIMEEDPSTAKTSIEKKIIDRVNKAAQKESRYKTDSTAHQDAVKELYIAGTMLHVVRVEPNGEKLDDLDKIEEAAVIKLKGTNALTSGSVLDEKGNLQATANLPIIPSKSDSVLDENGNLQATANLPTNSSDSKQSSGSSSCVQGTFGCPYDFAWGDDKAQGCKISISGYYCWKDANGDAQFRVINLPSTLIQADIYFDNSAANVAKHFTKDQIYNVLNINDNTDTKIIDKRLEDFFKAFRVYDPARATIMSDLGINNSSSASSTSTLEETDAAKVARLQADKIKILSTSYNAATNNDGLAKCQTAAATIKGKCIPVQGGGYVVVEENSNITSISYNTGASAGRPTSFIGNISDTTYTNEFECETAVRAGEKCKHISGASSGTGSGMGYKIVIDQPYIKITFGTPAPAQPADQSPITPNTNEGTIYAPSTGTFGKTAQQQCEATKTIGYECQPAGFKDGAVTYKLVKTDVAEQVDTNPLSAEQQKQQITSNQIGLGAVGCIVGAGLFAIATGGFGLSALGLCATGLLAGSVIGSRLSVSNNSSVPTSQYSQSDLNNVVKDTGMNSLKVNILTDDPGKCKNGGGEVSGFYGGSAAIGYRLYQCN